ncbi:MAG: response regulator [Treponema sp.]|jgi:putative two-component system response regulator|nr:response regulator [Treponema sp.]
MAEYNRETILAVDDNVTSLTEIRTILEETYDICLAKSAELALTILRTIPVDLILLDMNMPGISGIDFLALIRKDPSYCHIPVIIVSAHGRRDVIIEAIKMGANDFVVKPVDRKVLREKILSVFNGANRAGQI